VEQTQLNCKKRKNVKITKIIQKLLNRCFHVQKGNTSDYVDMRSFYSLFRLAFIRCCCSCCCCLQIDTFVHMSGRVYLLPLLLLLLLLVVVLLSTIAYQCATICCCFYYNAHSVLSLLLLLKNKLNSAARGNFFVEAPHACHPLSPPLSLFVSPALYLFHSSFAY